MKIQYKKYILSILLAVMLFFMTAMSGCEQNVSAFYNLLGSEISFYSLDGISGSLDSELDALAKRLQSNFSISSESGDTYKYNNLTYLQSINVCDDTKNVITTSKQIYVDTTNGYNPAVARLVDLWGFTERFSLSTYTLTYAYDRQFVEGVLSLPDNKFVTAFKSLADYTKCELNDNTLTKNIDKVTVEGVDYYQWIDLSGVVKGYYTDKAKEIIDKYKQTDYYISCGGSSLYLGENMGGDWDLSITDPNNKNSYCCKVKVKNKFVSSSGTYENCYTIGGRVYSHIIDSATGEPTTSDIRLITLFGDNGCYLDGLSTAIVNMGSSNAQQYLTAHSIDFILVTSDKIITNMQVTLKNDCAYSLVTYELL